MRLESVTFDARDTRALGQFWAEALDWPMTVDDDGVVVVEPPSPTGSEDRVTRYPELVFVPDDDPGAGRQRVHLDLATSSLAHQAEWVERLVALGATHADVGQAADSPWTVLADPEGNPFCVLDPRPEFSEHGSIASIVLAAHQARPLRDVWAAATGWDLACEDDDCVAFRRPNGSGPTFELVTRPTMPHETGKNRIHIDVAPAVKEDQQEVVARLEAAGAERADIGQTGAESWVVLADQEGNEFCVLSPRD